MYQQRRVYAKWTPQRRFSIITRPITDYREGLDLVLKGVNCADKSSLYLPLFCIIEPVGDEILGDDQSISEVGLHDLRLRLAIIPQVNFSLVGISV